MVYKPTVIEPCSQAALQVLRQIGDIVQVQDTPGVLIQLQQRKGAF